jgi:hypothetical protein
VRPLAVLFPTSDPFRAAPGRRRGACGVGACAHSPCCVPCGLLLSGACSPVAVLRRVLCPVPATRHGLRSKAVVRSCARCGYISSNELCKACVLLQGLAKGTPRVSLGS